MADMPLAEHLKSEVAGFWSRASCGEELYLSGNLSEHYHQQSATRYQLEPYIREFAEPHRWRGLRVLEIGVGLGADHQLFAEAGAELYGIDLTQRAVDHTRARFKHFDLESQLQIGDAENLPFEDEMFDLVYSWGVIHHSPDTAKAAREIMRVLKPGGTFKVMIYHKWSLVGYMLWLRYALLSGKPTRSLEDIYAAHLESPGTKAYDAAGAAALFSSAEGMTQRTVLTHGDLLEGGVGQRHRNWLLSLAKACWPRPILRRIAKDNGLFLLLEGRKPR